MIGASAIESAWASTNYTLETLGAFIGPLFDILIADYYLVKKHRIVVDDLFTMSKDGTYWYGKGYNAKAVIATVVSAAVAMFPVLFGDVKGMTTAAQYGWFIGCGLGFAIYWALMRNATAPPRCCREGTGPNRRRRIASRHLTTRRSAPAARQPEHHGVDDRGDRRDSQGRGSPGHRCGGGEPTCRTDQY